MSSLLEEIDENIVYDFKNKLKSCNFSIGLGNYAYCPTNKQLTSWKSSSGEEIESNLEELLEKYCDTWFKEELRNMIREQNWDKLFVDSDIDQSDYEAHFLKGSSIMDIAKSIKRISNELLDKKSKDLSKLPSYTRLNISETRKKLNKTKDLLTTVSELLEDLPEDRIFKLNQQMDPLIIFLTKTKDLIL